MIIGHLEQRFMAGEISEEDYKRKKADYVERLYELYVRDIITKEELEKKLNK